MKYIWLICCFSIAGLLWGGEKSAPQAKEQISPYYSVSNVPSIKGRATGFFRLEQKEDGRWWIIDPEGNGFVSFAIDHCNYRGHYCSKFGYYLYRKNNDEKFKTEAEKAIKVEDKFAEAVLNPPAYAVKWGDETAARLRKWGFNAMGSTCDEQFIKRGFLFSPLLRMAQSFAKQGDAYNIAPLAKHASSVFPNVFHPGFKEFCEKFAMENCAPKKNNPWYFGYYIDNELAWWGRSPRTLPVGIFNMVMKKNGDHTAKLALCAFLKQECDNDINKFNQVWKTEIASFDDILTMKSLPESTPEQIALKDGFLKLVAEKYFKTTTEAIRKADPNHLILGCRFADIHGGGSPNVWKTAGKYCDAITVNCYPAAQLDENCVYVSQTLSGETMDEAFKRIYSYTKRPMLVTEWSFPAVEENAPSTYGAGQRFKNQAERTQATSLFARTMLAQKFIVGYDYFMWCDEPKWGIVPNFCDENANYGLVNDKGEPYKEITEMFAELQQHPEKYRMAPVPERKKVAPPAFVDARTVAKRMIGANCSDKAVFNKNGDAFSLSNAKITLDGKIGSVPMLEKILLKDGQEDCGEFKLLLKEQDAVGKPFWRGIRKIVAVSGKSNPDGTAEALISALGWRYLMWVRVVLPPDSACFITELVGVKNISKQPLNVAAVYFRLEGSGSYQTGERLVPNLWKAPRMAYWSNAKGKFMGSVAPNGSNHKIVFYQTGVLRTRNADAFLIFKDVVKLEPEQKYLVKSKETGPMLHIFGDGDKDAFVKTAEQLEKLMHQK